MQFTPWKFVYMVLAILAGSIVSAIAIPADTATAATAEPTSLEQIMLNNLQNVGSSELVKGIQRATPENRIGQPSYLSFFTHSDEDARKAILQKFPVGTTAAQILREFPQHFTLFGASFNEHNGVRIKTKGKPDQIIGTRAITVCVDKYYPVGIAPVIQYRFARLAFNDQGELIDVSVITETDAI